jgi:hypothetical protein
MEVAIPLVPKSWPITRAKPHRLLPVRNGSAEKKREIRANKLMRMGIVLYVQSLKVTCAGSALCSRETEPKACCPPLFLRRLIEARKKFANFDEQTIENEDY